MAGSRVRSDNALRREMGRVQSRSMTGGRMTDIFPRGGKGMAADRVERKLAVILAADVAGYSQLMGADEDGTLARLNPTEKI